MVAFCEATTSEMLTLHTMQPEEARHWLHSGAIDRVVQLITWHGIIPPNCTMHVIPPLLSTQDWKWDHMNA